MPDHTLECSDNLDFPAEMPAAAGELADEALVQAEMEGREAAFETLFERHRRRLSRLVGRFCARPEKIEELVQDIFTKIYFGLGEYSQRSGNSFTAWISRIAINSCYDYLRYAKRRPEQAVGTLTAEETGETAGMIQAALAAPSLESLVISQDLVRKLLARLHPEDQLVLTLLDADELSVAEIASVTGWSESKVKVRAFRARKALREMLSEFL
ncbi:MAG TPA: RNA polymerase sigma factor [Acidobacteriota bacterium]|nr:RNA polymerase sigma factor [Acidobacteriota bacterium]